MEHWKPTLAPDVAIAEPIPAVLPEPIQSQTIATVAVTICILGWAALWTLVMYPIGLIERRWRRR
jgi:hypothetical protein